MSFAPQPPGVRALLVWRMCISFSPNLYCIVLKLIGSHLTHDEGLMLNIIVLCWYGVFDHTVQDTGLL